MRYVAKTLTEQIFHLADDPHTRSYCRKLRGALAVLDAEDASERIADRTAAVCTACRTVMGDRRAAERAMEDSFMITEAEQRPRARPAAEPALFDLGDAAAEMLPVVGAAAVIAAGVPVVGAAAEMLPVVGAGPGPVGTAMTGIRALTIRQPYADAIVHGVRDGAPKRIENRTRPVPPKYVGATIFIHAGLAVDRHAVLPGGIIAGHDARGAIIGTARITGSHPDAGCCRPWGMDQPFHWELADVRPLTAPVPAKGALGFWKPDAEALAAVQAQLGTGEPFGAVEAGLAGGEDFPNLSGARQENGGAAGARTWVYRVKGTTDEVTTCELCGRDELKGTVVLQPLDADGNPDGDPSHFGTACAAAAAGWTQRDVVARIRTANQAERERRAQERAAFWAAQGEWLSAWYLERYGTPDLHAAAKIAGTSPVRLSGKAIRAFNAYAYGAPAVESGAPVEAGAPASGVVLPEAAAVLAETAVAHGWTVAMERHPSGAVTVRAAEVMAGPNGPVSGELVAVWAGGAYDADRSAAYVGDLIVDVAPALERMQATVGRAAKAGDITTANRLPAVGAPAPVAAAGPGVEDKREDEGAGVMPAGAGAHRQAETDPPVAVFIASKNTAPARMRVLWWMPRSAAVRLCSDPRTSWTSSSLHWTAGADPDARGVDWDFVVDRRPQETAALFTELGVTPLSAQDVTERRPGTCHPRHWCNHGWPCGRDLEAWQAKQPKSKTELRRERQEAARAAKAATAGVQLDQSGSDTHRHSANGNKGRADQVLSRTRDGHRGLEAPGGAADSISDPGTADGWESEGGAVPGVTPPAPAAPALPAVNQNDTDTLTAASAHPAVPDVAGLDYRVRAALTEAADHPSGAAPDCTRAWVLGELVDLGLFTACRGVGSITQAGRLAAATLTRARVVIVPCGGKKQDDTTVCEAGEMYVGSYHQACRRAAEVLAGDGGRVLILSAKYGLVGLSHYIARYDLRAGDPGTISGEALREQAHKMYVTGAHVTALGGAEYVRLAREVWPDAETPLSGCRGIGEQLARLAGIYQGAPRRQ